MAPLVRLVMGSAGGLRGRALDCVRRSLRRDTHSGSAVADWIPGTADRRTDQPGVAARPDSVARLDRRSLRRGPGCRRHHPCRRASVSIRQYRGFPYPQRPALCLLWTGEPASRRGLRPAWPPAPSHRIASDRGRVGVLWIDQSVQGLAVERHLHLDAPRPREQPRYVAVRADHLRHQLDDLDRDEYRGRPAAHRNRRTVGAPGAPGIARLAGSADRARPPGPTRGAEQGRDSGGLRRAVAVPQRSRRESPGLYRGAGPFAIYEAARGSVRHRR